MNKTMRHVRLSTPLSVRELRLVQGLTIQAASELSGISIDRIKRWELKGVGNVYVFDLWELLNAYHSNIESCDFDRVPTKRQVIEAILSGASTATPIGRVEVDMDIVITLMKAEDFDVSALEALCNPDKTKCPAVSSSMSA